MNNQKHRDRLMIIHDKFRSGMFGQREVWEQWLRDAVAALAEQDAALSAGQRGEKP